MLKSEIVKELSDPKEAQRRAKKYLGKDAKLYFSTRKDKKYMIQDPDGKWVHFGQIGYEDATKHKNQKRIDAFKKRNKKWATSRKWSASFLSYWILW
jgi:2-phospho-L-lactate transferase/gluconeogenesis factor (CofD/UPF0052 family)